MRFFSPMKLLSPLFGLLVCLAAACGDNAPPPVEQPPDAGVDAEPCVPPMAQTPASADILDRMRALPGVTVEESSDPPAGYRSFVVLLDQPVDHAKPCGQTFVEHLTLIYKADGAPTVLMTTGYMNYYGDTPDELTRLLGANQIILEHRFFEPSRPSPADWSLLTIEQAAGDHHRVVELFRPLLTGRWVTTGASKGGMTSVYHRRFYPDDVDGTVAYVAPISFGAPDNHYDTQINAVGSAECRQALRDLQVELLKNRRAMLMAKATAESEATGGPTYTRIPLAAAVESAVQALEWSFWQYYGERFCAMVPAVTATDDQAWRFLRNVSSVSSSSDQDVGDFEPYVYQAGFQLGYPSTIDEHLDGLLQSPPTAFDGLYPQGVPPPTFDPDAMHDIDTWVRTSSSHILYLYGEWDPWSGGMFELGNASDSARVVAAHGTHGSGFLDLTPADQTKFSDMVQAWTGVRPDPGALSLRVAPPREPRPPAALLEAWKLRLRR